MSGGYYVDLPGDQGDRVEIEESARAVENLNELEDQVRNPGEPTSVDQRSAYHPNTTETTMQAQAEISAVDPPAIPGYLQDLFASLIASMKAGNAELARSVEQKMKESNKELQSSVEQRIKENNNQMREEIRRENEKLVEQFRLENKKLSEEFSRKLQAETSKLSHQVRKLQGDTEKELTAAQKKLQGISSEFEARLEQESRSNSEVTGELTTKFLVVTSEVGAISGKVSHLANDIKMVKDDLLREAGDLPKRQGESIARQSKEAQAEKSGNERRFELLSSAIDKLKDKLAGGTPVTCGTEVIRLREVSDAVRGSPTPPPSADLGNMARVENVSCSCNLNSCTVCVNGGVVCESVTDPVRHR
jgi:hypothetical protein